MLQCTWSTKNPEDTKNPEEPRRAAIQLVYIAKKAVFTDSIGSIIYVASNYERTQTMRLPLAFKWAGRIVALLLFLFWGAFFVEHIIEWFLRQDHLPPPPIWRAMALHAAMLAGLLLMVKWAVWGSLLTVVATTAFFASIGVNRFPFIALLNALPIALLGICFALSRYRRDILNTKLFQKGEH